MHHSWVIAWGGVMAVVCLEGYELIWQQQSCHHQTVASLSVVGWSVGRCWSGRCPSVGPRLGPPRTAEKFATRNHRLQPVVAAVAAL